MKNILLLMAVGVSLCLDAQTNLCALYPARSDRQYRTDLLRQDPAHPGIYYLAKGERTGQDTTFKWRIYKVDPVQDIAITDTFITVNDLMIRPDNNLAVVGQLKASQQAGYSLYDSPSCYSVWNTNDGKEIGDPILLNATFRQYRFDRNGYLALINSANNVLYLKPDGTPISIDPPALTRTSILSPVYPGKKDLFAIVQNLPPGQPSYSLLRSDPTQTRFSLQGLAADSIAHLKTGRYLVKKANAYSVWDVESNGSTQGQYPWYQKIGEDSILLIDAKGQYFFIDDLLHEVQLCTNPSAAVRSVGYYRGREPALMIRYTDDSLSLYTFAACETDPPLKVKFMGIDTLIPLFRTADSLFYLSRSAGGNLSVYGNAIRSGQLHGQSKQKKVITPAKPVMQLEIAAIGASHTRRFLLVVTYVGDQVAAGLIDLFPSGSVQFINVVRPVKALRVLPGGRFLTSTANDTLWVAQDLLDGVTIKPGSGDEGKVTMVEPFYKMPCADGSALFYYSYMVGTEEKYGRYPNQPTSKAARAKKMASKRRPAKTNANNPKNAE